MSDTFGPYSATREAGGLVFVSGQIGTATPDVEGQVEQALRNLAAALETVGLTLDDVVKTTVFLTDMGDFKAMNDIYLRHFPAPRPARSCVAVAELPRIANHPLKFEIEAVASRV